MKPLRFVGFKVWQVVVPADPLVISSGAGPAPTWPEMPICLVEGETDAGFTAVGECGRGEGAEGVERSLRELLGRDLTTLSPRTCWPSWNQPSGLPSAFVEGSWAGAAGRSYAILETLWLDAIGQHAGLPAHRLLGGAVRDRVPVDFWANRPGAAQLEELVERARALGLRGMKLKCGADGDTVHALAVAAARAPEGFHFTVDPMCAWRNFHDARELLSILSGLGRDIRLEDPFPHDALGEWQRAREAFPRLTYVFHARDDAGLRRALAAGVGDVFNLNGSGVVDIPRVAAISQFHGKDCWIGSALELGVLQHARLHAAATAPACTLPCDFQSEWVRSHTLVEARMRYENGAALVPNAPGLGVRLDHDAVARHRVHQWTVE